ncbi:hypothetical protein V1511DRAFT_497384, partial [Dipodascopsis uninucleata]
MSEELEEEIFSINAIYPECMEQQSSSIFVLHPPALPECSIQISFPSSYPQEQRPIVLSVTLSDNIALIDKSVDVDRLNGILQGCFHPGEVCVFDFLDELREVLEIDDKLVEQRKQAGYVSDGASSAENDDHDDESDPSLHWFVSDVVIDRKSKFEGRAIEVTSVSDARAKLVSLKMNKKISRATHNITAWRIKTDKPGITIQGSCICLL